MYKTVGSLIKPFSTLQIHTNTHTHQNNNFSIQQKGKRNEMTIDFLSYSQEYWGQTEFFFPMLSYTQSNIETTDGINYLWHNHTNEVKRSVGLSWEGTSLTLLLLLFCLLVYLERTFSLIWRTYQGMVLSFIGIGIIYLMYQTKPWRGGGGTWCIHVSHCLELCIWISRSYISPLNSEAYQRSSSEDGPGQWYLQDKCNCSDPALILWEGSSICLLSDLSCWTLKRGYSVLSLWGLRSYLYLWNYCRCWGWPEKETWLGRVHPV